jgi:hypothetical protein
LAVTCEPLWVTVALHACVICWPAPYVQVSVHELTASPRFLIVTSAPKPPGQLLLIA